LIVVGVEISVFRMIMYATHDFNITIEIDLQIAYFNSCRIINSLLLLVTCVIIRVSPYRTQELLTSSIKISRKSFLVIYLEKLQQFVFLYFLIVVVVHYLSRFTYLPFC